MESATATVRIMVGAPEEGGVSLTPIQPMTNPIAAAADRPTTRRVVIVPEMERIRSQTVRASTRYMPGVSVWRSLVAASEKELDSMDEPVSSKRMSGKRLRTSARISRAC